MVLRQIIVPGGVQVQDTSCVRPEDQDGGENNKGSIKKTKWRFLMEFSIKRRTPPPSQNGTNFHPFFYPTFFSFAIESYIYETDLTPGLSQRYHF